MTLSPRTPRKGKKRKGWLERRSELRRSRIKPKKRKPSEFARIYHSRERVAWVKTLPCVAAHWGCVGRIENAHTENGGMGRKADYPTIVPACNHHHQVLHNGGCDTFYDHFRVDLKAAAAETQAAWLAHLDGAA